MKRVLLITAAVGCFVVPAASAHANKFGYSTFRTPSGNIGCSFIRGVGGPPDLRCDIASGLKPRPARPKGCTHLAWGDSYEMRVRSRPVVVCHGDTVIDKRSKVLAWGTTWRRSGFECTSRRIGLTCKNARQHGWFLSRQHSYRF